PGAGMVTLAAATTWPPFLISTWCGVIVMLPGLRSTGKPRCCHRSVTALPGGHRDETGLRVGAWRRMRTVLRRGGLPGGPGPAAASAGAGRGAPGGAGGGWAGPRGPPGGGGPGGVPGTGGSAGAGGQGRTGHVPGTVEQTADAVTAAGGLGVAVPCDHRDDAAVRAVAARITADHGRLDLLVNNAWAGYERLNAGGWEEWNAPFWE